MGDPPTREEELEREELVEAEDVGEDEDLLRLLPAHAHGAFQLDSFTSLFGGRLYGSTHEACIV